MTGWEGLAAGRVASRVLGDSYCFPLNRIAPTATRSLSLDYFPMPLPVNLGSCKVSGVYTGLSLI